MSKSIRFLGVAIMAWAGVRAMSLGLIPGTEALAFDLGSKRAEPGLAPIEPTALPVIEPLQSGAATGSYVSGPYASAYPGQAYYSAVAPYPVYIPVPAASSAKSMPPQIVYVSPSGYYPQEFRPNVIGDEQAAVIAPASPMARPAPQITPSFEAPKSFPSLDRLSLSGWALMRNEPGPDSLANGGMLGGSQAGARLMWNFSPHFAASARTSAPINSQRGAEASLGLRYQPFLSLPVAVTVERRHGFKDYGRSAFAAFAEGGLYGQPLPWEANLEGYFQAGVVDFNNPLWFVDGQLVATRPLWRNLSAGFGTWAGAQPGLRRLDVGPRVSLKVGRGMRAHADYRLNVAGNAQPGSGATITLAGDF